MRAGHQRQVVLELRPPDQLVDVGLQEERIAESERRREPDARIGSQVRAGGGPRPGLARIRQVRLVQAGRRNRGEPIDVADVDARGIPLDAVGGVAVAGDVEGLVLLARVVEVPGGRQVVARVHCHIDLAENGGGVHRMRDRQPFLLTEPRGEETQEGQPLAVAVPVDQGLVRRQRRRLYRTRRVTDDPAQVGPLEVAGDAFDGNEIERLVLSQRPADRAAELLAMKILERAAIGELAGQGFDALKVEQAAVGLIGARLGDDVDHAAGCPPELRRRAARNDLELADRLERDVDRRPLPAGLFAEEAVVVVAAVQADVVEGAALPGEGDLVAVRPLDDADARGEGQQILELPAKDGCGLDRGLIERAGRRRAGDFNRRPRDGDRFRQSRHLHRRRERDGLADGQLQVVLRERGETSEREGDLVAPRGQLQDGEAAIAAGHRGTGEVGFEVSRIDGHARQGRTGRVGGSAVNRGGSDLRLCSRGCWTHHRQGERHDQRCSHVGSSPNVKPASG